MVFLIHTELRCTVNHTSDENIIYVGEPYSMNRVTRLMEECDSVIYTVCFRILTLRGLVAAYQHLAHMSTSALSPATVFKGKCNEIPVQAFYRPRGFQEVEGAKISRLSSHKNAKVVSPTHQPPLHSGSIK